MGSTDRLPSELLVKIFKIGRDEELDFLGRTFKLPYALIRHSFVCARWRKIALATPELWSYIQIPLNLLQTQSRVVEWVKMWIVRSLSETRPLDISIECERLYEGLLALVFDYIIPHARRWRSFRFKNPLSSPSILSPLETVHAPSLEELSVDLVDCRQGISRRNSLRLRRPLAEETDVRSFFASTPSLRVLTLCGIPTHFPFERLTSLELQHVTVIGDAALRDIAERCPDLERLTLHFLSFTSSDQKMSTKPIHMGSLRKLSLLFDSAPFPLYPSTTTESKCVLTLLDAPKLTYMKLAADSLPKLHNLLPEPSKLTALRSLNVEQVRPFGLFLFGTSATDRSNTPYLLSLPHVTHVHLKDIPGETLGIDLASTVEEPKPARTRPNPWGKSTTRASGQKSNTIEVLPPDPEYTPQFWPHLEAISFDCTIRPRDLIWLCRVVAARPQIRMVSLSDAAHRHLSSTLVMRKRIEDGMVTLGLRHLTDSNQPDDSDGSVVELNAIAWLADKVELKRLAV